MKVSRAAESVALIHNLLWLMTVMMKICTFYFIFPGISSHQVIQVMPFLAKLKSTSGNPCFFSGRCLYIVIPSPFSLHFSCLLNIILLISCKSKVCSLSPGSLWKVFSACFPNLCKGVCNTYLSVFSLLSSFCCRSFFSLSWHHDLRVQFLNIMQSSSSCCSGVEATIF